MAWALEAGHDVYKPVVDDAGVDVLLDRKVRGAERVQVKRVGPLGRYRRAKTWRRKGGVHMPYPEAEVDWVAAVDHTAIWLFPVTATHDQTGPDILLMRDGEDMQPDYRVL